MCGCDVTPSSDVRRSNRVARPKEKGFEGRKHALRGSTASLSSSSAAYSAAASYALFAAFLAASAARASQPDIADENGAYSMHPPVHSAGPLE